MKTTNINYSLFIIAILFFVFGFLTWANGVLIPFFRIGLELNNFQSTWVVFSSYIAYFFISLPSSFLLQKTGYKNGMTIGLLTMALGTFLFIPAAYERSYTLFLIGIFITGSGLALLQTAANPYVAVLGPIESHARRVGILGLSNKIAGIMSLAALGSIFLTDADQILAEITHLNAQQKDELLTGYILKSINPYLLITGMLIIISLIIHFSKLPEVNDSENIFESEKTQKKSIYQHPNLIFGIVALFFSGACEAIPIDGIILYSNSLGIPISESRYYAQYTLITMTIGYVLTIILIPKYWNQQQALLYSCIWGLAMTIMAFLTTGTSSVIWVISMGLSSAMLWGTIWGLALMGLGNLTKLGAALLLMSIIGGAIFSMTFGWLIDFYKTAPTSPILILVPCNIIMGAYAIFMNNFLKRNYQ